MRISSRRVLITTLLLSMATLGLQVGVRAANNCKKPNTNTIACYTPPRENPNYVCNTITTAQTCAIWNSYNINNFPDGSVDADSGATKQDQSDCYQACACVNDPDNVGKCKNGTFGPWAQGAKTVNNPDITCPPKS